MRTNKLKTKIFLDSGDPEETQQAIDLLGFLDGQTTNPTLIAKHPETRARLERGEKFTNEEIFSFYQRVVSEISALIPQGSVSIEVYADEKTSAEEMKEQAREMNRWIPNAHIKFPLTQPGLEAVEQSVREGMRVNVTLCFNQEQAAAVYAATRGAKPGQVFLSPFIGRLDDIGRNGMDLVKNIITMYEPSDGHVQVLAASVRTLDHFFASLALGVDIITAPLTLLRTWAMRGMPIPDEHFVYQSGSLQPMKYEYPDINEAWTRFNLDNDLTRKGIERFSADWNHLIA